MINRSHYPHPVDQLISRGPIKGKPFEPEQWFDYLGHYGLTEIDVPPLIDLAAEERRFSKKRPKKFYAPLHAVRALGQLGDMAADSYLVQLLDRYEDVDLAENVTVALTMVGPQALDLLMDYFNHPQTYPDSRDRAIEAIHLFAKRHPDQRDRCVRFLTDALANYQQHSALTNGFIVHYLVELGATEAAALISQAFVAGQVEEDVTGSWAAVQVALGLAKESDFTPDELMGAGDRALEERRRAEKTKPQRAQSQRQIETTGLSGSYSITEHLKR